MRLTHIKLSGFKTFVDPTTVSTPGRLVGIVGPNGCGKSNVIDAVRWVLGESKASALRGESMQDVIFNGAGERKPVSRASVELHFDNSDGRIGGQWGQYAELSIKRVLTRDGDSAYYINNIPVRRRDIYDLFLGTGLGPRAYAIIEQGMISRVIEAKPEELRIFLEEAAGVSKYKERRKETENRLSDTRENLARIEDIRLELGNQLDHLAAQAQVATEYRELETRLKTAQHLHWFSKQQDAARARERCQAEVAQLRADLEAIQSDVRNIETQIEQLREKHYAANDTLHDRQGAFYAASTEVSRLQQQLEFAHSTEKRMVQQVEQINAQIVAFERQAAQIVEEEKTLEGQIEEALAVFESAQAEEKGAQEEMPAFEEALREATQTLLAMQQELAQIEQTVRIAETQRENSARTIDQLRQRRERLEEELAAMDRPGVVQVSDVEEQLAQENEALQQQTQALAQTQQNIEEILNHYRETNERWQQASQALNARTARHQALASLQNKIEQQDTQTWLENHRLTDATHLWQKLDIEEGWEDALEAVLRERLNALEFDDWTRVAAWLREENSVLPRLSLFSTRRENPAAVASPPADALYHKLRIKDSHIAPLLADMLYGMHCCETAEEALHKRGDLAPGTSFVTKNAHIITAQSVTFFAPDSELHGVLIRKRELSELDEHIAHAEVEVEEARVALDESEEMLRTTRQQIHDQQQAIASQQKRCHNLELELTQLRKEAEAQNARRQQLTRDIGELEKQEKQENEQRELIATTISEAQMKLHDEMTRRESLRHARNEADVALTRGRERLRHAERHVQETHYAERSLRDRLQESARRRETCIAQRAQQQTLLEELSKEKQAVDWAEIEAMLQQQLAVRSKAENLLSTARNELESLSQELRAKEEARMSAGQNIDPARNRIEEMRLKVQAAELQEQQYGEQLTEAEADLTALPGDLKAWGRASLPNEIDRLQKAIAALGAVNMAALEELSAAEERKTYLDRQAADLTEAMATLENAIRQIDKESRELLKNTFDLVNENFARLFPILFGGGQAKLVLTGEEILDSGIQVFAQPPGKRNSSIHLLSGGEKALTATALVFALFQINPAPFCLLDEVDAPLDDANTVRFCNLVREMSEKTQFLFITHNKITMEMATQLLGITMVEPGVSKTVAVDIAEAIEMTVS
ncbi:MAG: chromosome segregation protein SMC [Burkholderiales bacterium]|nr:chromosome segregation protein SMC [Burkholderiales bacterium]